MFNTFLQAVLSAFMWGFNRRTRPPWSTGLFVALACIVAAAAGIMSAIEGKKVKKVEGVPWGEEDLRKYGARSEDVENGGAETEKRNEVVR
ncbi:hypothetical protein GP486_008995 [Trichoglossum hirsutum]|uniref:Uncharacterized protein n=1 Tax=Trichoglossum hirsutum TaxID=265104 RepID=A0A9P8HYW6_9PEZI|nr:hypothetical protein GP486_008995 [Trichoglossum hirsutum]